MKTTLLSFGLTVLLGLRIVVADGAAVAATDTVPSLFDPTRHMRVDEVRPGMRGHGLSVFQGTEIERFEVEVISVLRNFDPKQDLILIRCEGANLEHTGSISGMSGSPIYLVDESGRERMVGAFAYGWPLAKDPVAGVQPIEYMLKLPELADEEAIGEDMTRGEGSDRPDSGTQAPSRRSGRMSWSLSDSVMLPGMDSAPDGYPLAGWDDFSPNPRLSFGRDDVPRLVPLATPLMTSGLSGRLLDELGPVFEAHGLVPLQAGGGGGVAGDEQVELAPGSVMAVPLLMGDLEFTAVGTATEVIGDRVFGFGHPFMGEGPVTLPMGSGSVNAVVARISTSFKLGSLSQVRGALYADQSAGVAGRIGESPAMAPIELRITYADGTLDESYRFEAVRHPRYTPLISSAAFAAALSGHRALPRNHTIDYELTLEFANGETVEISNTMVNTSLGALFFEVGGPMMAAADNPFERVMLERMTGRVRVVPEARHAEILSIHVPRLEYRPGETVRAFVTYRPFRAPEAVLPIEMELPSDLPEGEYELKVSDWQRFLLDEQREKPFRFRAESVEEVFAVLNDVAGIRHNALYLRLKRQEDGVAIGRSEMPRLPSSRREVLTGSGRSNHRAFVSTTEEVIPTDWIMRGEAEFKLTVDREAGR